MLLIDDLKDLGVDSNVHLFLRERGKIVPGSHRWGHNVFTITGRNLLSKLLAWQTIAATDIPFTHRRTRWMGVGIGGQPEVTTVAALAQPTLVNSTDYLATIQSVTFPTSTSVRFIKEFSTSEITVTGAPVTVTEAGLYGDVSPANAGGTEDVGHTVATDPTLNPTVSTNPPIAYKAFEGITKTVDFTLEIRWEFRF
jgi:hypothetical protein